ncbi:MbcA/ParS/Xre antitoxin family protein [Congregibacter brevis]|uniref:MbcA/ParS/Xre antitoxin family protein n=1 Tax=Congregibacter brevis TaxID=3081201 RepID=A0ABZ0IH74_9GAMM|nr:MbcA/ParS/Xre antitoxin family protein [Congregibacter sp. IMCC45268]
MTRDSPYFDELFSRIASDDSGKAVDALFASSGEDLAATYHAGDTEAGHSGDVRSFVRELSRFFDGDEELTAEWLNSPLPALSGTYPKNLLSSEQGRFQVLRVLGTMRFGDPA